MRHCVPSHFNWSLQHTTQGQDPFGSRKNRIFSKQTCTIFNNDNEKIILCLPTLYYIYVHNFNKTYIILHIWYHNECMFIVTYFISVCFKKILISAPWRRQESSAETCSSYVKNCKRKLQKNALFGVTPVIYVITMRGMNNVSRDICRQSSVIDVTNMANGFQRIKMSYYQANYTAAVILRTVKRKLSRTYTITSGNNNF